MSDGIAEESPVIGWDSGGRSLSRFNKEHPDVHSLFIATQRGDQPLVTY